MYNKTNIEVIIMEKDGVMPQSNVYTTDVKLKMDDPDTITMFQEEGKKKCLLILRESTNHIERFKKKLKESKIPQNQAVILFLNVDDANGRQLSKILLPEFNWDEARRKGEIPFVRGIFSKGIIRKKINANYKETAQKLKNVTGVAIMIVDHNVIEIFEG